MTYTNLIKNRWWALQMGHYHNDIEWTCYAKNVQTWKYAISMHISPLLCLIKILKIAILEEKSPSFSESDRRWIEKMWIKQFLLFPEVIF